MFTNCVMGWDASWTSGGTGAWSVIKKDGEGWRVMCCASTPQGEEAMERELSRLLEIWQPGLIAVDMPVADHPVTGFREADRATTRAFSRFGCPVHSPNPRMPGEWGWKLIQQLHGSGYRCLTELPSSGPGFAEVYPHSALLKLLRIPKRFPYKISRASRYWPELSRTERREMLLKNLEQIRCRLGEFFIGGIRIDAVTSDSPVREIKAVEDKLDALICAWCGLQILEGYFEPFGDADAVIWNPRVKELDLLKTQD